jgi:hypothetical protein
VGLEVRYALGLFFFHVFVVLVPRPPDRPPPRFAVDVVRLGLSDRVADFVVVLDGVLGLLDALFGAGQQRRVEDLLFGGGMALEDGGQRPPPRRQRLGPAAAGVVEVGERPAEVAVLLNDDVADVGRRRSWPGRPAGGVR